MPVNPLAINRAPVLRPLIYPRPAPRRVAQPSQTALSLKRAAPTPPSVAPFAKLQAACQGQTVFVLASGPSLTLADVAAVRGTGRPVITTNTTFRLAPWATALFGQDRKWHQAHAAEVAAAFRGLVFSGQPVIGHQPLPICVKPLGIETFKNSGAGAIALALHAGAARIVALGLDCQPDANGHRHWHGEHAPGLGNAVSMPLWFPQFKRCAAWCQAKGVPVLNASRATALEYFPRASLEDILADLSAPAAPAEVAP